MGGRSIQNQASINFSDSFRRQRAILGPFQILVQRVRSHALSMTLLAIGYDVRGDNLVRKTEEKETKV
jgi:hypothetical protein